MLLAKEKWPGIGEPISSVGHSSCTAGMGSREWMEVRRVTEERQERGTGWGVMNSWPISSRMPSNLCYKEGHPSHRQAEVLYTTKPTQKHTAHMLSLHSQSAQWSQPRLPCITRKLYHTLRCVEMFPCNIFKMRRCATCHPHCRRRCILRIQFSFLFIYFTWRFLNLFCLCFKHRKPGITGFNISM